MYRSSHDKELVSRENTRSRTTKQRFPWCRVLDTLQEARRDVQIA